MAFETASDCELAFYAAFNACDVEAMKTIWSEQNAVCVHPGQRALLTYDSIIRSWSHIFSGAASPNIDINPVKKIVNTDLAIHIVEELISVEGRAATTIVLATNSYRREESGWKMIEHHASLVQSPSLGQTMQ